MGRCSFAFALGFGMCLLQLRSTRADLVVGYDAVNTGTTAGNLTPITDFGGDVVAADFTRGAGLQPDDGPTLQEYNSSNWKNGTPADDAAAWNFSFTSTSFFELSNLVVRAARSNGGPMILELQIDVGQTNVFSNPVGAGWIKTVNTTADNHSFDLSTLAFANNIAFRLLGYDAQNSGTNAQMWVADDGNYDLGGTADVVLNGAAVIPEPSAFLFGGLVCGVFIGAAAWRRFVGVDSNSAVSI